MTMKAGSQRRCVAAGLKMRKGPRAKECGQPLDAPTTGHRFSPRDSRKERCPAARLVLVPYNSCRTSDLQNRKTMLMLC